MGGARKVDRFWELLTACIPCPVRLIPARIQGLVVALSTAAAIQAKSSATICGSAAQNALNPALPAPPPPWEVSAMLPKTQIQLKHILSFVTCRHPPSHGWNVFRDLIAAALSRLQMEMAQLRRDKGQYCPCYWDESFRNLLWIPPIVAGWLHCLPLANSTLQSFLLSA